MREYIRTRQEDGLSFTQAVQELARIVGSSERSVWRWMDGGKVPTHATMLLQVWRECTPDQRKRWFNQ